jgi:hypothetical protein
MGSSFTTNLKVKEEIAVGPGAEGKIYECQQNYTNDKGSFETKYSNSTFKSINLKMTSEPNNDNYKIIHGGVETKHYVRRGETTKKWDETTNEWVEEKLLRMEENLTGGIPLF